MFYVIPVMVERFNRPFIGNMMSKMAVRKVVRKSCAAHDFLVNGVVMRVSV